MAIFRGTGGQGDSTTDTTVTTVTEKAAEAASSATSAANSATSASNSATSAETSATNAATSESNAATSATNASTSATAAETAKTAAQAAQTAAETAETNAETAEANAVTAKNQAVSAKDNAVVAQTAAETAETNAETAYSNTLAIFGDAQDVQDAVDSASASATTATTKASEAATSATNAANSATSAGTSETNAASSASSAATSAASANSYATDAQTAQTAAETAQAAAEAAEASINGLYLGSLADDPTLDGNGVAVTTGDLYFNTTAQEVRVYTDGDVWEPVVDLGGDVTVNSLTSNNDVVVKGNLEVQGTTITVDSATAQTIDLGDNDRIRLGDSDDLQVYHDGTDSYIANSTGTLKLSGNTDVTGNITVSGTVDGRDVAADGTKLDGIEASADVTDTANVTAAGALMDSEVTNLAQVKAFDSADYATAAQGATADSALQTSGGTLTGDLAFGDNVKAKFGASDDLQIFHNGSDSIIKDAGTGNLDITTNGVAIRLVQGNGNRLVTAGYGTAGVKLWYGSDDTERLSTTSSGVDVTGTLVSDGLTVDGDASSITFTGTTGANSISAKQGFTIDIDSDNDQGAVDFRVTHDGGTNLFNIDESGDISFYEDTGTTAKLTWDASAEELQFKDNVKAEFGDGGDLSILHNGTNSQINGLTGQLQIANYANDNDVRILADDGSGGATDYFRADGSTGEAILYHYGSEKLATKSTGIAVTDLVSIYPVDSSSDGLIFENTGGAQVKQYFTGSGATDNFVITRVGTGGSEITLTNAGSVILAHGANDRLATTSTGIDVTGTVTADGLTVSNTGTGSTISLERTDGSAFSLTAGQYSILGTDDATNLYLKTNGSFRQLIKNDGDISFYDDSSSSQDFYWDASTSRLGLGTTSPSHRLDVQDANVGGEVILASLNNNSSVAGSGSALTMQSFGKDFAKLAGHRDTSTNGSLRFYTRDTDVMTEAMRIDSLGRLGIGTTNPTTALDVTGTITADELTVNTLTTLNNTTNLRNVIFSGFGNNTSSPSVNGSTYAMLINKASTDNYYSNAIGFASIGSTNVTAGIYGIDTGSFNAQGIAIATGTTSGINEVARFNSHGLSFSQSNSASASLGDYEEGTFTPEISQGFTGVTYSVTGGSYTKVGRLVTIQIRLQITAGTATGDRLRINGLPFTPVVSNGSIEEGSASIGYWNAGVADATIYIGTAGLDFYESNGSSLTGTEINDTTWTIHLSGSYTA